MKIKIYKIETTETFMADEMGTSFSLEPWGTDTSYYRGGDDGGIEYVLPEGFEVAEDQCGEECIYKGDTHCSLCANKHGNPMIVDNNGVEIWLKKA